MSDDLVGRVLGHYAIELRLGQGGMGVVYRALDVKLRRTVALKVLPVEVAEDDHRRRRLEREARAAAAVTHANIATIYEVGEEEGRVYIAMELIEGENLRTRATASAFTVAETLRIGCGIARGLARAHEKGIVHRDLKPDNVMLTDEGEVKILDFGLAKYALPATPLALMLETDPHLSIPGQTVGTPGYMSPEQATGREVDARADQYSLGVVLYEMLSGACPFLGDSAMDVIISSLQDQPRPLRTRNPQVPLELEQLVARCMAKKPEHRFSSTGELLRELERIEQGGRLERLRQFAGDGAEDTEPGAGPRAAAGGAPPGAASEGRAPATITATQAVPGAVRGARRRGRAIRIGAGLGLCALAIVGVAVVSRGTRTTTTTGAGSTTSARTGEAGAGPGRGVSSVDRPAPRSSSPQALALYREALVAGRSGGRPRAALERAVALDPDFAAAQLRLAITYYNQPDQGRVYYQRAVAGRERLDEADRGLVLAYEPFFLRQPADAHETRRRLEALAARFPDDAEIARRLATILLDDADPAATRAAFEKVAALDPEDVAAPRMVAQLLQYEGKFAEADAAIERCIAQSPMASTCLQLRARRLEEVGPCHEMEVVARRWLAVGPEEVSPYRQLAFALAAEGRPLPAAAELLAQSVQRQPEARRAIATAADRRNLALLAGDFQVAEAAAREEERLVSASTLELDHERPARALALIEQELGDRSGAAQTAQRFLSRREAWETDPRSEDSAIAQDPSGLFAAIARRGNALTDEQSAVLVATRLAGWDRRVLPWLKPYLWVHLYARAVETEDEAALALAALPRYRPLPPHNPKVLVDDAIGRTLLLGGRSDEALPYLERATRSCYALEFPIEQTRAFYFLGLAREQKEDSLGACDAYRVVIERWGKAKSASLTLKRSRERTKALGCK